MIRMKLMITISGPRVHDVGYRDYLLTAAMNLALPGFSALNWTENGKQQVIALVEGDDIRVAAFRQLVEAKKPERAEVQDITIIEYDGDVGRTGEFAMMCSFKQLNKAVPVLLEIRDDMKEMKGDIKEMKGDIKEMKGDIKEMKGDIKEMKGDIKEMKGDIKEMKGDIKEMKGDIKEMKGDIKEMKGDIKEMKGDIKEMKGDIKEIKGDMNVVRRNTDPIPQILEELQPGYAAQFRQVQTDIKAIKERLGMP